MPKVKSRNLMRGVFDPKTVFQGGLVFAPRCSFGWECVFGEGCSFGEGCLFGDKSVFGEGCSFADSCVFGDSCKFGGGCVFGPQCSLGGFVDIHESCSIKDALKVDHKIGVVYLIPGQMCSVDDSRVLHKSLPSNLSKAIEAYGLEPWAFYAALGRLRKDGKHVK